MSSLTDAVVFTDREPMNKEKSEKAKIFSKRKRIDMQDASRANGIFQRRAAVAFHA